MGEVGEVSDHSARPASDEDEASIRDWFDRWGSCVARLDYAAARALFEPDVIGFGTYKDFVEGLDALEASQWRSIWPTIEAFAFDVSSLRTVVSGDRRWATAMLTWSSIGIVEDGSRYHRPGRATVVLRRRALDADWRGVHTHFSQFPGERKLSFGERDL